MTFDDMTNEVADRYNLSAASARDRIGRSINECYKALCSSIGLQTSARGSATANTAIGSRTVTFGPTPVKVQKIIDVYDATVAPTVGKFIERSFEYLRDSYDSGDQSREFAIQLMGATSVTVFLGGTATTVRTLTADVEINKATLVGTDVPAFAEAFHDILLTYASSIELEKLEKYDAAQQKMKQSKDRTSELRMYIAKSAYKDVIAGSRGSARSGQPLII